MGKTATGQLDPLRFDPWSPRYQIFRILIYPSQLALHTVSLLGQLAPLYMSFRTSAKQRV